MPTLPWTTGAACDPGRDYLVMASRLPLARFRDVPAFLRNTIRIRRQLRSADGLIGYSLDAKLFAKTFWTLSVWRDQGSLEAFAGTAPHDDIVRRTRPHLRPSTIVTWTEPGTAVPVSWDRARRRIVDSEAHER